MITTTFTFTSPFDGEDYVLTPHREQYANGRLALTFTYRDEEMDMDAPFSRVTVNLPDEHLNEGEFFVKDWAENAPLVEALEEAGWLIRTGREVLSGYVAPAAMRAAGPLADYLDAPA